MSLPGKSVYDVIVIGAGCAGLATATAANELGLDCVVLEKATRFGGGSAISSGYLWIGANHLHEAAGGTDTPQAVTDYLRHVGAGAIDEDRMATFVAEAPGALRFFEAAGIPFRLSPRIDHYHMAPGALAGGRIVDTPPVDASDLGDHGDSVLLPAGPLFRVAGSTLPGGANSAAFWAAAEATARERPGLRASGAGLVTWLIRAAAARGVPLLRDIAVERLIVTDGRVGGVATAGGITIAARHAVVIASGGYESSPELVHRFEALPGWQSMFPESITGDGLVMAVEQGAATHVIGNNLSVFLGFRNPDEAPGSVTLCRLSGTQELPSPHTIVVNRRGCRFADESFFQAMAPALHHFDVVAREQPNLPCWLIFDQQYADRHSFGGRPPGAAIPSWVDRATSIEALARKPGIDAEGLAATIQVFNADVQDGVDRAFRRGQSSWGPKLINMFHGGKTPLVSAADLQAMGYAIIIVPSDLQRAAIRAMQDTLAAIARDGHSMAMEDRMVSFRDREALVGTEDWLRRDAQYAA